MIRWVWAEAPFTLQKMRDVIAVSHLVKSSFTLLVDEYSPQEGVVAQFRKVPVFPILQQFSPALSDMRSLGFHFLNHE